MIGHLPREIQDQWERFHSLDPSEDSITSANMIMTTWLTHLSNDLSTDTICMDPLFYRDYLQHSRDKSDDPLGDTLRFSPLCQKERPSLVLFRSNSL